MATSEMPSHQEVRMLALELAVRTLGERNFTYPAIAVMSMAAKYVKYIETGEEDRS